MQTTIMDTVSDTLKINNSEFRFNGGTYGRNLLHIDRFLN